jgi:hypothetical protein
MKATLTLRLDKRRGGRARFMLCALTPAGGYSAVRPVREDSEVLAVAELLGNERPDGARAYPFERVMSPEPVRVNAVDALRTLKWVA